MDEPPSSLVLFRRVPSAVGRAKLQRFASTLRDTVAAGGEFECLITDDEELRRLNREFRRKDYATDVLSFPASEVRERAPQTLGSIAISFERASEQAGRFGHSVEQELQILMLHGLLHLLGFDHESDRGQMARKEADWRQRLALPDGLIERAHR
jgi:probable rRNA maturation factor